MKAGSRATRFKRAAAISATACVAMLGIAASPAAAQEIIVASCPGPPSDAEPFGGAGDQLAQTFVAQGTGNVTSVDLVLSNGGSPNGDFVVQIVSVVGEEPTDVVLGTGTIPAGNVPNGSVVNIPLSVVAPIVAGEQYAVRIFRTSADVSAVGTHGGDACTQGELFQRNNPTGPWGRLALRDMVFTVYLDRTGAGGGGKADGILTLDANKGKVEKGRKVTLLGQYDVPTNEACENNRAVELQRKRKNAPESKFKTFKTVQTNANGNYETRVKVRRAREYRAVVQETTRVTTRSPTSRASGSRSRSRLRRPRAGSS